MIIHDVQQGTPAWLSARLGRITASNADRIITPKTLKSSSASKGYIAQLVTEWALQQPIETGVNAFMERGSMLEAEARDWLAWEKDIEIKTCGFIESDDSMLGCSPDGLMPNGEGVEIKVYEASHHMEELLYPSDDAHKGQIQFSMMVTGTKYWTRLFWNPVLPSVVRRIEWDAEYIEALDNELHREGGFLERLAAAKANLLELGFKPLTRCTGPGVTGEGNCGSQADPATKLCQQCAEEIEWRKQAFISKEAMI